MSVSTSIETLWQISAGQRDIDSSANLRVAHVEALTARRGTTVAEARRQERGGSSQPQRATGGPAVRHGQHGLATQWPFTQHL